MSDYEATGRLSKDSFLFDQRWNSTSMIVTDISYYTPMKFPTYIIKEEIMPWEEQ